MSLQFTCQILQQQFGSLPNIRMYYSNIPSNYSNLAGVNAIKTGQIYVANKGLEHINCILPAQNNMGGLYLGDIVCLLKNQILNKHEIKSVLTCMIEPISRGQYQILSHKILPIRDTIQFPIIHYFNSARQFIDQSRQKGQNILVHCHAGVSRSATIVCAYLMIKNNWNIGTSLQFIKQKRYRAKPNISFINQLQSFYQKQIKCLQDKYKISKAQEKIVRENKQMIIKKKQERNIIITLEQQVQTHDQLLLMEQRNSIVNLKNKNVKSLNTMQKEKNKTNLNGQKSSNQQKLKLGLKDSKTQEGSINLKQFMKSKQSSSKLNLNQNQEANEFYQNKSQIYFKKTYDPNLVKTIFDPQQINISQLRKNPSTALINTKGNPNSMKTQSLLNPNIQQINSNFQGIKTPIKEKKIIFNDRMVYTAKKPQQLISDRIIYTNSKPGISFNLKQYKVNHKPQSSRQSLGANTRPQFKYQQ